MKIWVDADACPKAIKDILFRVAQRTKISVILVANQRLHIPHSDYIEMMKVDDGPDIADDEIEKQCAKEDLVITADIPLAARVVKKGAIALDPRGRIYDSNNIGEILNMRDFMDSLRGSGIETGGAKSFNQKDRQTFANALDKFIAQRS
ncbi:MAG: YaiI/YqxD family protein [Alphaproteobacteria bacterium]